MGTSQIYETCRGIHNVTTLMRSVGLKGFGRPLTYTPCFLGEQDGTVYTVMLCAVRRSSRRQRTLCSTSSALPLKPAEGIILPNSQQASSGRE